MRKLLMLIFLVAAQCVVSAQTLAQSNEKKILKVAIIKAPPFVMETKDSHFGIAIDIWRQAAADNFWEYEFITHELREYPDVLQKLHNKEYDVVVGPTSSTAERAEIVDFSRPFYVDHIGVIVKSSLIDAVVSVIETFFYSAGFLLLIFIIIYTAHIHIVWFFERGDKGSIPPSYWQGIRFVFWAHLSHDHYINAPIHDITIPKTGPVKTSLIIWILSGYLLTTLISGTVVSFMTFSLSKAEERVEEIHDLHDRVIGAVQGTYTYSLAKKLGLRTKSYDSFEAGIGALEEGNISAFIADHSSASYILQQVLNPEIHFSQAIFHYSLYGFAFSPDSPLVRPFNKSLVKFQNDESLRRICKEYTPNSVKHCEL